MTKNLPLLIFVLFLVAFSSCKDDNASPLRNVRFDPDLLNKLHQEGGACPTYSLQSRNLGTVYTRQVLVAFTGKIPLAQQQQVLADYGFVTGMGAAVNSNSASLQPVQLQEGLSCSQVEQAIKELAADTRIAYVAPDFLQDGKQLVGISNEVLVTVAPNGLPALYQLAKAYNAQVLKPLGNNTYLVKVDKHAKGNALELANYLQGKPGITQAEPDFVVSISNGKSRPLQLVAGNRAE